MRNWLTAILICLFYPLLGGACGILHAQVYDAEGQYVDTTFHDHINRQDPNFIQASLVVAEPGGALYSVFGHACLHLKCDAFKMDYIFTYDSEEEMNKILTFLAGRLHMGMIAIPFEDYVTEYAKEGRGVVEYPLLLPPDTKQRLWQVMDEQQAKGMYLPYDYEARGCAATCAQFVTDALRPTEIQYAPWTDKQKRTRREMCNDFAKTDYPWNMWFIMTIVGTKVDKEMNPASKLIIPTELVEAWQTATVNGKPLLGEERIVSPSTQQVSKTWFTPVMAASLVLLLVLLGWVLHKPYADWLLLTIITLLGMLVTYLVVFSSLPCTDWNWLIIPFNPLPALLWHWRRYWALPYAGVLVVWLIAMIVWPHTLVATANLILVVAEIGMLAQQKWNKRKTKI